MREAAVALIEKDGLFLSVSRKNNPELRGFPGGQLEIAESAEEAMERELFEETGLKALEYTKFFSADDGKEFNTTCFLVTKYDGEAYSKEAGLVEWVSRKELEQPPFGWYNKKVFKKYFFENDMNYIAAIAVVAVIIFNLSVWYKNLTTLFLGMFMAVFAAIWVASLNFDRKGI